MATLNVGAGQAYATLSAAVAASRDGDVINVQAGTYVNDFATISTDITIVGVGGMANFVATVAPPNGKGILVTQGDVTIQNLSFSGAAVGDGNGAGIRYESGNLVVIDSYFHDNQMNLLGTGVGAGTIRIVGSEFANTLAGSNGLRHNFYVNNIASLVIDDSYFHDAYDGHQIKSRAQSTTITNSRIYDGTGAGSYSIDLPNGGVGVIRNNVIEQGPHSDNPFIIAYGEESAAYAGSSLLIEDNVVVNDLSGSSSVRLLYNASTVTAIVDGNSVWGLTAGQIALGSATVSGTTFLSAHPSLDPSAPWLGSDLLVFNVAALSADKVEGQSGSTAFTFTVTRGGNTSIASSASWAVTGSGANAASASDFAGVVLPSGTVSFAAGETSKTITVNVAGDTVVEPDEGFTVTLSNPTTGATIGTASAGGTIRNDDTSLASLSITALSADKAEGQSGSTPFTFTVTRGGNTSIASSASWAVTGSGANAASASDFAGAVLPSGTVSFAAGETSKTITVNVAGDTVVEPDQGFTVTLSNPAASTTIGTASASGAIRNDDLGTIVEAFGATSLVQVANTYFLYAHGTTTGPQLKLSNAAVTTGQFGNWTPLGAEQMANGTYQMAWKNGALDQYIGWIVDRNGNYLTAGNVVAGATWYVESLESTLHQDLNGDAKIGPTTQSIETNGATSLTKVADSYFFNYASNGPQLKMNGVYVAAGQSGNWMPLGAEQAANGTYQVAWKNGALDQYTVWQTDSAGNYQNNPIGVVSGTSTALKQFEGFFQQDLNGNGMIDAVMLVSPNGSAGQAGPASSGTLALFVNYMASAFATPAGAGTGLVADPQSSLQPFLAKPTAGPSS
jgi:Tryptophan-rich Synechocystis species C-terminal domain/Calx-beta domain